MQTSAVRLVGARDGRASSTAMAEDPTYVYRSPATAKAALYMKAAADTHCSIGKRALGSDGTQQQICPRERYQEPRKRTFMISQEVYQRPNISARRKPPKHKTTRAITLSNTQSESRLVSAMEEKAIEGLFWSSYLPLADQYRTSVDAGSGAPYQMLLEITSGSPLVKRCARAVAFANLGRENGDRRLNMRGAQIYSAVVRQARDMLEANPATIQQRDDLLACCVVMCTYELLRDDTERGSWYFSAYHHHVRCLCHVLRTVNVMDEPSTSMKYVWREARLMAGRASIFLRQPVYGLERPPQWTSTTTSLNLSDDVLDHTFALSQWFSKVDKLTHTAYQSQQDQEMLVAFVKVVHHGLEIAEDLRAWERRAMAHYCNSHRPTLFSLCPTADGELLNVLANHWMICVLLHSQLQMFVARFLPWYPDLSLPFWIDPWPPAVFIAAAGPMISSPRFGTWAALTGHRPMVGVIFYFAASGNWHTPEARQLREWVEDKNRLGNEFLRKFFYGLFANADEVMPQKEIEKIAQTWYGIRDRAVWKGDEESNK